MGVLFVVPKERGKSSPRAANFPPRLSRWNINYKTSSGTCEWQRHQRSRRCSLSPRFWLGSWGSWGYLNPREMQGKASPRNPAGSVAARRERGAELGGGIPVLPGLSATFHQKSPPSFYPGPAPAGIASSPAAKFPLGLGANPKASPGSRLPGHGDLGGGSRAGLEWGWDFWGALCPPRHSGRAR